MEPKPEGGDRETRLRWSLGVLHFLVIAAFTWARIVRDGALLSRMSVEWVPYLTVAVLLATAAVTPLVARLTRHRDPFRAFARVAVVTGVTLLLWELLLRDRSSWSAAALYVWVGAYGPLLVAQFWVLTYSALDPQQARRHIGFVGALGILGGAVSGLMATGFTASLTLAEVLGLTAVTHLGAGALALGLATPVSRAQEPQKAPDGPPVRALTVLREDGYARLLALVIVLGAITGGIVDYQFKFALQMKTTDAAELGRWLGLFNVAVSLLALAAQVVTGWLLTRVGSRVLAFVLPGGVAAGAAVGLVMPAIWPPVLTRLWETASRHSVTRTANEFFFLPLQGERRAVMKHASEGFLTRGGEVGASLLLVGLATLHRSDLWHLSLMALCVAGGWAVVLGWLSQAYGPALSRSLDALLRPGRPTAGRDEGDRSLAVPELAKMLRSQDERHVLFALGEMMSADPDRARREAERLTQHRSPAVRARARRERRPPRSAAQPAGEVRWLTAHPLYVAMKSGDEARARAACEAVVASRDRLAAPVLLECLQGATRGVARDTLVSLGDVVSGALGDALADPATPARVRRDVAVVLGRIGTASAVAQLARVGRDDPRPLQSLTLMGMNAARKREIAFALDATAVRDAIRADILELQARLAQRAALAAESAGTTLGLLPRALDEAVAHGREHVFRRLALLYPAREMLRAHRGLISGDERIGAYALEYLEATLSPDDREMVMPVLRSNEPEVPSVDDVLQSLASGDDVWLATLAVHAIGLRRATHLRPVVHAAETADPTRLETVRWALARL
ncbi:MAG TPA: hypothetical protein VMF13_13755 [Luteitalea sp.]|nr:hypothetical protein [Luteitalea sp.]